MSRSCIRRRRGSKVIFRRGRRSSVYRRGRSYITVLVQIRIIIIMSRRRRGLVKLLLLLLWLLMMMMRLLLLLLCHGRGRGEATSRVVSMYSFGLEVRRGVFGASVSFVFFFSYRRRSRFGMGLLRLIIIIKGIVHRVVDGRSYVSGIVVGVVYRRLVDVGLVCRGLRNVVIVVIYRVVRVESIAGASEGVVGSSRAFDGRLGSVIIRVVVNIRA